MPKHHGAKHGGHGMSAHESGRKMSVKKAGHGFKGGAKGMRKHL